MKISYIVLAHKNIHQLLCLLEAIQGGNVSIYLHLDRLAGKKFFQDAVTSLKGIHNLTFLRRYTTNWGGFGLVDATLEGIRQICRNNDTDYVILLSGQDFPVKPQDELMNFLTKNSGTSFLEHYKFPHPYWKDNGGFDRITRWYFSLPFKQTKITRWIRIIINQTMNIFLHNRKFPDGFTPFGGSQWWCLYKNCISYIDTNCINNKRFMQFFKTVRIPDEIFFHTILMNSPLSRNIINRKLTYVDWNGPPFPRILTDKEIAPLRNSDFFFARKFDGSIKK